jgi:zinc-ribbon domain
MKQRRAPSTCPVCGEDVPPNAKSCPECGACERSGWGAGAGVDGLDLPDDPDEFDYDKFVAEEFGGAPSRRAIPAFWWWIALLLLVAFASMIIRTVIAGG